MSPQALIEHALAETPPGRPVWIALSGGLDSSLLLTLTIRAAHDQARPVYALHVNHGLQASAGEFERHCQVLCSRLGVPLFIERVAVATGRGLGWEGAAREARYAAFAKRVPAGDVLWLAQHRKDQAETFLLAALRGSGIRGLAAMPGARVWQGRYLVRPWLDVPREELETEAVRRGLVWVEDPSNVDVGLDRNFLRHQVLPLLESRWPTAEASLAQTATWAGEADALLAELASHDLSLAGGEPGCLPLSCLASLSLPRQRLLIRHCCEHLELTMPPASRLATLIGQLEARRDARVHVNWIGGEARVWRGRLYLQVPTEDLPNDWQRQWDGRTVLQTPAGQLAMVLEKESGGDASLILRPRRGGECLHLPRRGRRDLKRLLQEYGVPPWQRARLLVVWHGDQVVAVLGEELPGGGITNAGWRLFPAKARSSIGNRPHVDTPPPAQDH
ncbi:hypothetical protein L861_21145 [Litchfieldella anticariensis FP35 = DSM 16096]|uniref:tRNA(Ile)-lysidine synthase n=1 Tax=Litchfieldella anticariensis (strain DSM 16096 / CECT 5854 / CIP 108499 / LMG 22089 / FP35) TaxID=1121939 RepID=S2LAK7_LITA3|nr:tRNA lysidine(34) synthetase TilS [Halomonas anticariensis]EPC01736.1 hypothetical protein L861_21145 [Halomonas anticariensis FP35 = DSM 16096]